MNRVISMIYELKDAQTGEILESNKSGIGVSFITGKNQILQKIENEALNMQVGDEKFIFINPSEGMGEYNPEEVVSLPKEQFVGVDLSVGMELYGESESGESARVIVKEILEDSVVVDYNHPYAGKSIEFFLKITQNREASADEELSGMVAQPEVCGCGGHGDDGCCGGAHHEHGACCGRHH